jgi:citrate synthase
MEGGNYYPGLKGIVVEETEISAFENGGLSFRGYLVDELAADATFPEVVFLLLQGELPTHEELADFQSILTESIDEDKYVLKRLKEIPLHVELLDAIRTGISTLAHFDPHVEDNGHETNYTKTLKLLAQIPQLISDRHRQLRGLPDESFTTDLSFAGNLFKQFTGRDPFSFEERALEQFLILYAEHQFDQSTFTARLVTSAGSDLYSSILAAIGAYKGSIPNYDMLETWELIEKSNSQVEIEARVRRHLAIRNSIPGFRKAKAPSRDPRLALLKEISKEVAKLNDSQQVFERAEHLESTLWKKHKFVPKLDWRGFQLLTLLGIDAELYAPLCVISRIAGWSAHIIEQAECKQPICPSSRYVGMDRRQFPPLSKRG